jgi:site-specific DNA-cytosine methylase
LIACVGEDVGDRLIAAVDLFCGGGGLTRGLEKAGKMSGSVSISTPGASIHDVTRPSEVGQPLSKLRAPGIAIAISVVGSLPCLGA